MFWMLQLLYNSISLKYHTYNGNKYNKPFSRLCENFYVAASSAVEDCTA